MCLQMPLPDAAAEPAECLFCATDVLPGENFCSAGCRQGYISLFGDENLPEREPELHDC